MIVNDDGDDPVAERSSFGPSPATSRVEFAGVRRGPTIRKLCRLLALALALCFAPNGSSAAG